MNKTNALSAMGRMSYSTHMLFYPGFVGAYIFVIAPWYKKRTLAAEQEVWDNMIKQKAVDPDLFNPFTPIPFHNNIELKYAHAHINLRGYINEHHLNPDEYAWKGYYNSFDHNGSKKHLYNWS